MRQARALIGTLAMAATVVLTAGPALSDAKIEDAIKGRKAVMTLYRLNLGQLAGMAKGQLDYDAAQAKTAAVNLHGLATMKHSQFWPKGSDSTAFPGKTRAKLEAWTTYPASAEHQKKLIAAAAEMVEVADTGLENMAPRIGAIGGACGACHKEFREK